MKIIALSGKKQSGKDTVFQVAKDIFLLNNKGKTTYGSPVRVGRVAFGDAIKYEVSEVTGFRVDHIEEHKEEFRTLLQVWGSDFRRHFFGESYWLNKMDEVITKNEDKIDIMFITDLRFKNEAEYVKSKGGQIIRVQRRMVIHSLSDMESLDTHASENDMDSYNEFDYWLVNDKDRKDIVEPVRDMLKTLNLL